MEYIVESCRKLPFNWSMHSLTANNFKKWGFFSLFWSYESERDSHYKKLIELKVNLKVGKTLAERNDWMRLSEQRQCEVSK